MKLNGGDQKIESQQTARNILNLRRRERSLLKQGNLHSNLGFHVGSDQALGSAVMLDVRGSDDANDPIAVSQSGAFSFHNQTSCRLRWDISK
jgi:hypothetical protein